MDTQNQNNSFKLNEIKKCLAGAQRLGMDLAGLFSLNLDLSGAEKQLVQSALAHLKHIVDDMDKLVPKKDVAIAPKEEPKRSFGSMKL